MAKVNYMDRENVLREYGLTDEAITFGREATNTVVVADPSVSRQHAWIEKRPDGYYLIDKNSSNGTYVNGKKISQQKLAHNDKINLGSASLVYEDEEQGATFILPKGDMPDITHPESPLPNERETDAFTSPDVQAPDDRPLPPPPPLITAPAPAPPPPPRPSIQAPPPPPPQRPSIQTPMQQAPVAPPPAPPKVEAEAPVGILCPSCRKVVEHGARFCPFCGASLGAPKSPPPAPPSPPAAASPKPPLPPPPQAAPVPPRPPMPQPPPVAPPRPPAPSFGAPSQLPPAMVVPGTLIYAGFGPRLVAVIIDSLLLTALMIPFIIAIGIFMFRMQNGEPSPLAWIVIGVSYVFISLIGLLYQLIFIGKKGATPGKKFMKLRVTFPDGTYPIGIGKAFLRMIGYMISGMICYIGFLMVIFDKEQHRALHDKIAGTVVIRES